MAREEHLSGETESLEELHERFQACMEERGLRSTAQRRTVTDVFFRSEGHFSVEELLEQVRRVEPSIGYATVYRTVKLLEECELASERRFGDGVSRYEVKHEDEHHDHLICLDCSRIIEFENDDIERMQEQVAKAHGFELSSHRHDMWGHCVVEDCPHREAAKKKRRSKGRALR